MVANVCEVKVNLLVPLLDSLSPRVALTVGSSSQVGVPAKVVGLTYFFLWEGWWELLVLVLRVMGNWDVVVEHRLPLPQQLPPLNLDRGV